MSLDKIEKCKDIVIEILDSPLSDYDKAEKIIDLISLEGWEFLYRTNDASSNDKLLKRIGANYRYFSANGIIKKFKNPYKCTYDEAYKRLDTLKQIESIIDSNISDDEKMDILLQMYPSYAKFKKKYSLFIKFGSNDERLDNYRDVLDNFNYINYKVASLYNNETLYNNAKYRSSVETILEKNLYLENYLYAEWLIKAYIDYDRNYLTNEFLQRTGTTEEDFIYSVKVVKFLNPELYKEYVSALEESNDKRMYHLDKTFLNLANGIKTGVLFDGTLFNILEFYRRVPFKNTGSNFRNKVFDFMNRLYGRNSETYKLIAGYMLSNNIVSIKYINKDNYLMNKIIISGVEITPEIVNDVFDYMDAYNLPRISQVYNVVVRMYINNEIDMEKTREKLQTIKASAKKYNNPHKLIKK